MSQYGNGPLVDDILAGVKYEFGPNWTARYRDDNPLLFQLNRAIEEAAGLLQRWAVPFHQKSHAVTLVAGQVSYPLPEDFVSTVGLYGDGRQLPQVRDEELRSMSQAARKEVWAITWPDLTLSVAPKAGGNLTLLYWPRMAKAAKGDNAPWDGRLNSLLVHYTAALLKNIDEFDLTQDQLLRQQFEKAIIEQFVGISPRVKPGKGWLVK